MMVYVKHACCGGKHVFYVGRSSQDVSLALESQQCRARAVWGVAHECVCGLCTRLHLLRAGSAMM